MVIKRTTPNQSSKSANALRKTSLRHELSRKTICINKECRLRVKGCKGFEGCPGYKTI